MAIKITSTIFFVVLFLVHVVDDGFRYFWLPLSEFRDGPIWEIGYFLFATLLVIGTILLFAVVRLQREIDILFVGAVTLLLFVTAVTSSVSAFHVLCSFFLLAMLYGYYAMLLHHAGSVWFFGHMAVPALLLLGTQFHSYGLWQKGFIVYFVLVANVHYQFVASGFTTNSLNRRSHSGNRKRKVYVLDDGPSWRRRIQDRPKLRSS